MNERIKQLAEQAGAEIKAEYEDESRRNRRLYNEIFLPKFAELIVRECAEQVDWILAQGGKTQGDMLKEHFGVKE